MIDTHCHLDDEAYSTERDCFLAAQREAGVEAILIPGIDQSSIEPVVSLAARYPHFLYPALGLHPENVKDDFVQQLEVIHSAIERQQSLDPEGLLGQRIIAIGEIGLDYHFDTTYHDEQAYVLRRQMEWAQEMDLPVMIHMRDATEDTLRLVGDYASVRGVFHCFSGSRETAERIIGMGYYIGIGGILTFKNCKLATTLDELHRLGYGLEHVLLETDSPYMAPVPHRGERNESRWIRYVVAMLSGVYGCSEEEVIAVTTANAKTLFALK